jgi:hypothetical protein
MRMEEGGRRRRRKDRGRRMEDSRQDLRTECRGGDGVVGFGRIWPCISSGGRTEDGRWRREDGGVKIEEGGSRRKDGGRTMSDAQGPVSRDVRAGAIRRESGSNWTPAASRLPAG